MLEEVLRYEVALATVILFGTVVVPSTALASLLTLWIGGRMRPRVRKTLGMAFLAAAPWSAWMTFMTLLADGGTSFTEGLGVLSVNLAAGLLGAIPAAFMTRRAAVMPRGRRADDR